MRTSLFSLYFEAIIFAGKKFLENWLIVLVSALVIAFNILAKSILSMSSFGTLFIGLLEILAFSYYYYALEISLRGKITLNSLKHYDFSYFWKILSAAFIVFIMQFSFQLIDRSGSVSLVLALALVIILNPLPEVLYQSHSESFDSLREAAYFVFENWLEWFIPLCLILAPFAAVFTPTQILRNIAYEEVLFPVMLPAKFLIMLSTSPIGFATALIAGLILGNYLMFLRMFLFKKL